MGFSCFRGRRPRYAFPFVPNRELQVGLTVLTLSLTLSHGERERITEIMFAEMMANGMRFSVFTGKAHATTFRCAERRASGGFDCFCPLPSPLPRGEGTNCRESQQWSDFSYLIPSPRGRGLGRGQSRFGMPLSRFSKKPPFKTHTDKRDCRAWMSDLVP